MTDESKTRAFTYPPTTYGRRHGPNGYRDYRSYRPWLRDEFSFRCVYCLMREQWGRVCGEFDLDHFVAQVQSPDREADYDNLVYACHACNLRKGRRQLPEAAASLTSQNVRVYEDGRIQGLTADSERIIRFLSLNSPVLVRWRRMWMRIVQLAEQYDPETYRELMMYPMDLPDLANCSASTNIRKEGVDQSYFARRQRGELADTYLF